MTMLITAQMRRDIVEEAVIRTETELMPPGVKGEARRERAERRTSMERYRTSAEADRDRRLIRHATELMAGQILDRMRQTIQFRRDRWDRMLEKGPMTPDLYDQEIGDLDAIERFLGEWEVQ